MTFKDCELLPAEFYKNTEPIYLESGGEKIEIANVTEARQILAIYNVETSIGHYQVTEFYLNGIFNVVMRRVNIKKGGT